MENQEEFVNWLAIKLEAKDEQDLQDKLQDLGTEGIKQAYELFVKETSTDQVISAKDGAKLDYLKCLELKKGGKMSKCGCGGSIGLKGKPKFQQGGVVVNGKQTDIYAGVNKRNPTVVSDEVELITPKGNKVYKGNYDMFSNAQDYGRWLDGWAIPDREVPMQQDPESMLKIGHWQGANSYPTDVVRDLIKTDPYLKSNLRFDMTSYKKLAEGLGNAIRGNNSLSDYINTKLGPTNIETAKNRVDMSNLIPRTEKVTVAYLKGGKIDNATAVGGVHDSKKKDAKSGVIGDGSSKKKDGKSAVGLRKDATKNDKTGLVYTKGNKKDSQTGVVGAVGSKKKDAQTGVVKYLK